MTVPLIFKELQLRNFMSFGANLTTIDLTKLGSTLIIGENLDTSANNGSGKCVSPSTIINIRNKHTGEIHAISIGDFYEKCKKSRGEG